MIKVKSYFAIAEELGNRLKLARLNRNLTQSSLAKHTGLTRRTIVNAERGRARLQDFVAILQAMDLLESLDLFLPPQPISPIELAKLQGKQRKRASANSNLAAPFKLKW